MLHYYQGPGVEQTFNVSLVAFLFLIQIQKKLCTYYGKLNTNIVIFFSDLMVDIRTPRPVTERETRKVASGQDLNCSSDAPVTHCHCCRIASPTALAHELSFAPGESTTQRLSVHLQTRIRGSSGVIIRVDINTINAACMIIC